MKLRRTYANSAVFAAVLLSLGACSATYRDHGYAPNDEDLAEVIVGVDTRASVEETVGVPTTGGVLSDGGYFYVESRMRQFAYQAPQEVSRQVVAISFDTQGVVSNIERYSLEDGQVVPISRRITRTGDNNTAYLRQIFSALGRFDPAAAFE